MFAALNRAPRALQSVARLHVEASFAPARTPVGKYPMHRQFALKCLTEGLRITYRVVDSVCPSFLQLLGWSTSQKVQSGMMLLMFLQAVAPSLSTERRTLSCNGWAKRLARRA
jgi:hypothetical protein